jgi:hypothetical protein
MSLGKKVLSTERAVSERAAQTPAADTHPEAGPLTPPAVTRQSGRMASLREYYDGIDQLCGQLRQGGAEQWAEALANAKAGGATSGEILSHTGALLRSLSESSEASPVANEVAHLRTECDALWHQND